MIKKGPSFSTQTTRIDQSGHKMDLGFEKIKSQEPNPIATNGLRAISRASTGCKPVNRLFPFPPHAALGSQIFLATAHNQIHL